MSIGTTLTSIAIALKNYGVKQTDDRESLSEFSSSTRLSADALIEGSLVRQLGTNLQPINQLLLGLYTGHYLAATNRICTIGNVTVSKLLSPLNDKPAFADVASEVLYGNSTMSKDMSKEYMPSTIRTYTISMEGMKPNDLSVPVNIAVGKVIEVELTNGRDKITVKVTITLKPAVINEDLMMNVLDAFVGNDNSFIARWHKWRAGGFNSFAEYAFGLDILAADKKVKLLSGDDDQFNLNRLGVTAAGIASSDKQLNIASSMIVVSKDMTRDIERAMRGKLVNQKDLMGFFKATGSMVLLVVDPMKENVVLYQRGIDGFGVFTFEDIKPMGDKANGIDFSDIMKSWSAGKSFNI